MRMLIAKSNRLCARELGGGAVFGYAPGMSDLSTKIRRLRISLGMNQTEFGEMLGVTQGSVSRWEKGSMPDHEVILKLAGIAKEDIKSFLDVNIDGSSFVKPGARLMVRGVVAAGVWVDAYEWPEEEWFEYTGGAHVTADPSRRFGLRVEGDSMNMVYPHGTILDCVSVFDVSDVPSGRNVVVVRKRTDDGLEATVKEYFRDADGRDWLVPRSHNPAFQRPIPMDEQEDGIEEVRIIALVVGSYRPE